MPFRAFWRFAHFPSVRVDSRSTHALVPVEDDATLADGFDARTFIGKGDAFNSPAFASQAQAVLRADPRDHNPSSGRSLGLRADRFRALELTVVPVAIGQPCKPCKPCRKACTTRAGT